MYTEHFRLNEKPFSISPDPRYLYLSQRHADALAHLLYGISESGGFIQLTGEVGTGKTTLIRSLLGQLPEKTEIALILNPQLSTKQFLQAICHELRLPYGARDTAKAIIDRLNSRLLELHADNHRVVLIVDEAQTMSPELLEQVRLLTNLETSRQKLLQIILIGQPELRTVLARPDMRQIAQRITGRYHLEPLSAADTAIYVAHRMKVAGGRGEIFSKRAVRKLYRLSRGIPRLINVIADRALLAAYTRDSMRIDGALVKRAAQEVFGQQRILPRWWPWTAIATGLALLFIATTRLEQSEPAALQLAMADAGQPAAISADPSLAELLALSDSEAATADLFRTWDASYANDGNVCEQAAAQALRCLRLEGGSLSEIRELNRPVRLELVTRDGARRHLLLTGLDAAKATVRVDGRERQIAIADLTHYGFGEHLLLWRPALSGSLAAGAQGPAVIWLRNTLGSITGSDLSAAEPDLFDAVLTEAVRAFQDSHGLFADGLVDDRTLISIQSAIGLIGVRLKPGLP